mmetsp:Transcript_86532/g.242311  ORF Transcript_86532/g.242311 Transcript_86532/m.242311 type:complete len:225 (-) Transcript_86532:731-1405(-)
MSPGPLKPTRKNVFRFRQEIELEVMAMALKESCRTVNLAPAGTVHFALLGNLVATPYLLERDLHGRLAWRGLSKKVRANRQKDGHANTWRLPRAAFYRFSCNVRRGHNGFARPKNCHRLVPVPAKDRAKKPRHELRDLHYRIHLADARAANGPARAPEEADVAAIDSTLSCPEPNEPKQRQEPCGAGHARHQLLGHFGSDDAGHRLDHAAGTRQRQSWDPLRQI